MTLLIDADWLIYSSCCACEQDIQWDTNLHTLHADERDVYEMIDGRVAHYQPLLKAIRMLLCALLSIQHLDIQYIQNTKLIENIKENL